MGRILPDRQAEEGGIRPISDGMTTITDAHARDNGNSPPIEWLIIVVRLKSAAFIVVKYIQLYRFIDILYFRIKFSLFLLFHTTLVLSIIGVLFFIFRFVLSTQTFI